MFIKLFIFSLVILVPAVLGIGIKLLFHKEAALPTGCCSAGNDQDTDFTCACGSESCCTQIPNKK
jgi:hypothetical protein